jgi:hypothetical protein
MNTATEVDMVTDMDMDMDIATDTDMDIEFRKCMCCHNIVILNFRVIMILNFVHKLVIYTAIQKIVFLRFN